jgi:opacity protein-like surface antigen
MLKKAGVAVAAVLMCVSLSSAQEHFDASVNLQEVFSKGTSNGNVQQDPTNNWGVLVTARAHLAPKFAIEFNYGRLRNAQKYALPPFDYRIPAHITEYTGSFVVTPFRHGKWEPFFLVGAGVLRFDPQSVIINGTPTTVALFRQTKPTFSYGFGTDYRIRGPLGLRVQYRGLFYSPPDFKIGGLLTEGKGHLAEPSIGVVFKF